MKLVFTILLLFSFQAMCFSQSNFGVNGKFLMAGLSSGNYAPSYSFGITYRKLFEKNLGIQSSLNYVKRGSADVQVNTIELPLLFCIANKSHIGFEFQAGPYIAYTSSILVGNDPSLLIYKSKKINNLDAGFTVSSGIGFFLMNGSQIIFNIELYRGFVPIVKIEENDSRIAFSVYYLM